MMDPNLSLFHILAVDTSSLFLTIPNSPINPNMTTMMETVTKLQHMMLKIRWQMMAMRWKERDGLTEFLCSPQGYHLLCH
ncbi:hypothetical protein JIR001_28940 [Polycladomyces abyssicola]|uniref:Uncharacterized protein n=1 Tax=Polycladomyces abyssicola TaxID=1125966 RepID=A0A8D5UGF7_9BACL|nr:hypothetical protein JIR001_28940 [Polycladomyces abyssicola]